MTIISTATAVLLRYLQTVPTDALVTCDSWRQEADDAMLNVAERGSAPRNAARLGYLKPLVIERDGQRFLACLPSSREHGKGNRVLAYVRTNVTIPNHVCEQVAS